MFATEIFYNTWKPVPITHTKDSLEISLQFTQGDTYIISIVEGGFASTVKYKWKGTLDGFLFLLALWYSCRTPGRFYGARNEYADGLKCYRPDISLDFILSPIFHIINMFYIKRDGIMNQEQNDICNEFPKDNWKNFVKCVGQMGKIFCSMIDNLGGVGAMIFTILLYYKLTNFCLFIFITFIAIITIIYYEKGYRFLKLDFKLIYIFLEPLYLVLYYLSRALYYMKQEVYCNSDKEKKSFYKEVNIVYKIHLALHDILIKNLSYNTSLSNYIMNAFVIFYVFLPFYHSASNMFIILIILIFIHSILFLTITRLTFSSRDEDKIIVSKCKICKNFLVKPIVMFTGVLGVLTTITSFIVPHISITLPVLIDIMQRYHIDTYFEKCMQILLPLNIIPMLYIILYPVMLSFFIACKLLDILSPIFYGEILDKLNDQDE